MFYTSSTSTSTSIYIPDFSSFRVSENDARFFADQSSSSLSETSQRNFYPNLNSFQPVEKPNLDIKKFTKNQCLELKEEFKKLLKNLRFAQFISEDNINTNSNAHSGEASIEDIVIAGQQQLTYHLKRKSEFENKEDDELTYAANLIREISSSSLSSSSEFEKDVEVRQKPRKISKISHSQTPVRNLEVSPLELPSQFIRNDKGQICFSSNLKPVKFKVLKNKPKNGEFRIVWEQKFQELKEYKDKFGNLRVTRNTKGYIELGNWVAEQRRKMKNGKTTEEQFNKLNSLGFEWDRSYYFHNTFRASQKNK